MIKDILTTGAPALGLSIDDTAAEKFETYFDLLVEKNRVMNLTAITDERGVATLHFLDSLAVYNMLDCGKKIIDIGSGAGFPGLPLKIYDSGIELTMLDALQKRVSFLSETAAALGLSDVECIHARAEEAAAKPPMRDGFDHAVSRAVARLNVLAELCLPFVRQGGSFIALKSVDTENEIAEAESAVKTLGGAIEDVRDYAVPETDVVHRAVIIRKMSPTPKGYPRRFAKIQKSPL